MKDKIVIFGCGKLGRETAESLNYFNINNYCFTDNNKLLWGAKINGVDVMPPSDIRNINCVVVIALADCNDVLTQLEDMNTNNRIIFKRDLELVLCDRLTEKYRGSSVNIQNCRITIFESLNNEFWGGGEKWSYVLYKELFKLGCNVKLVANDKQADFVDKSDTNIELIKYNQKIKWAVIENLVKKMQDDFFPCTIICNIMSSFFFVAYILKQLYPNNVNIIAVQHNDRVLHYNTSKSSERYLDNIICVSKKIRNTLSAAYKFENAKLLHKENFAKFMNKVTKKINYNNSLKICYFGRIEQIQKRLDLLPNIITELEKINKNYVLSIAGKGSYEDVLKQFACEENLSEKVVFRGFLSGKELNDFLSRQDVFFSCSDYEGASLSMIEGMSLGLVPVVTNVSGVDELVEDGENGYIAKTGDVVALASAVDKLERNRNDLREFSLKSRKIVSEKCTLDSYIKFIISVIDFYQ